MSRIEDLLDLDAEEELASDLDFEEEEEEVEEEEEEPQRGSKREREEIEASGEGDEESWDGLLGEESELARTTRPRKRLKKIKSARDAGNERDLSSTRRSQLESMFADDEDLDAEPMPAPLVEEDFSDEDDLGRFIVDDQNRPVFRPRSKTNLAALGGITAEQMEAAQAIFGTDDLRSFASAFEELAEGQQDEEADVEDVAKEKYKLLKEHFDPEEVESLFLSDRDEKIYQTDLPERFQLRYEDRPAPTEFDLEEEAFWMVDEALHFLLERFEPVHGDKATDFVTEKITAVLREMLVNHHEIPYIVSNAIDIWNSEGLEERDGIVVPAHEPSLEKSDLWEIYELDNKYYTLQKKKASVIQMLQEFLRRETPLPLYQDINPEEMLDNLRQVSDRDIVDALLRKATFLVQSDAASPPVPDRESDVEEGEEAGEEQPKRQARRRRMPKRKNHVLKCREFRIDQFAALFGITPSAYAANVSAGRILEPISDPDLSPLDAAAEYVCSEFPRPEDVLAAARSYLAEAFSLEPDVRFTVLKTSQLLLLNTEPTELGARVIDLYHPFASVKKVHQKPLREASSENEVPNFARMKIAEQEKLIKILFELPPEEESDLLNTLMQANSEGTSMISELWNIERNRVIQEMLSKHLLPMLYTEVTEYLNALAQDRILKEVMTKLEAALSVGPSHTRPGSRAQDYRTFGTLDIKFMGMYYDPKKNIIHSAVATLSGQIISQEAFRFSSRQPEALSILRDHLEKWKPDAVALGADSWEARTLHSMLQTVARDIKRERGVNENDLFEWPCVSFLETNVANIYASSSRGKKEFPDSTLFGRKAISLARRLVDPLCEFAGLVNRDDDILSLALDPLQSALPKNRLRDGLTRVFVSVVNVVGVDLLECVRSPWRRPLLQFVAGFGPRKAKRLLDKLSIPDSATRSLPALPACRTDLIPLLGKTVYQNAASSLRFPRSEETTQISARSHLLDTTRIHPDHYQFAIKIAHDAVTEDEVVRYDEDDDLQVQHMLSDLFADPSALNQLDILKFDALLRENLGLNMKYQLNFCKTELSAPYADYRTFVPLSSEDAFFALIGASRSNLYINALVTAEVLNVRPDARSIPVRVQEFDVVGHVPMSKARVGDDGADANEEMFRSGELYGTVLPAVITNIEPDKFNIVLSFTKEDLENSRRELENTLMSQEPSLVISSLYDIVEDEVPVDELKKKMLRFTRAVVHDFFRNVTYDQAVEILKDKEPGEVLIRPSSRGFDRLTAMIKFYGGQIIELEVIEKDKPYAWSLGKKLYLPAFRDVSGHEEEYGDINELIMSVLDPMTSLAHQIGSSPKFRPGTEQELIQEVKALKKKDPKSIPYLFGVSDRVPGRFILYYQPRDQVLREVVSVTPTGFKFRNRPFKEPQAYDRLIYYFKKHYKENPHFVSNSDIAAQAGPAAFIPSHQRTPGHDLRRSPRSPGRVRSPSRARSRSPGRDDLRGMVRPAVHDPRADYRQPRPADRMGYGARPPPYSQPYEYR